jgi:predicted alpha/beta hydrolase family esterase
VTSGQDLLILTVPGLNNSGPGHWQTLWEQSRDDCRRVELGLWEKPHRNTWINNLNLAIRAADRPVILAAHSLGCLAVAWWAALERPGPESPVKGALLVAPPAVDHRLGDPRVATFAPMPRTPLPFPAILVGSHNDGYMRYREVRALAGAWGCQFADAGRVGHINADSGLGEWPFGQFLLERLILGATRTGTSQGYAVRDHEPPQASLR